MNTDVLLQDCDVAIITSPAALFYLSGFDGSDAVILLSKDKKVYLTNPLYEIAVKTSVRKEFSVNVLSRQETTEYLKQAILQAKKAGVECDDMTVSRFRTLFYGSEKSVVDLSPAIAKLREIKSEQELSVIKTAESIVDKAYTEALSLLKEGVTERSLKDAIERAMISFGADGTAFETIVAFGENAAMPHAVCSDRTLKRGDCVLMDFGAKYKGYCSDFTRTVCFGAPTEKFRQAYQVVLNAQRAAIEYLEKGGRSACEADRVARAVVESSAFKGKFTHTLGHGVGIMIHEAPTLSTLSEDTLRDGMVFTIEPGVYVEGEFGIRIESLVTIENGKLTVIDRSNKEIYTV